MLTDAWLRAGRDAKDIFLIQQVEQVIRLVAERVNTLSVQDVTLLDGGDGQALPRHVASFPATVRAVLEEVRASTGVDVVGILSGPRAAAPSSETR
jgi:flotillin